ncbi:putative coiled-coil [Cryptosporidium sp. chipmunk genotype I]|uniref:putative coiled-coil n=1 Tax=Cryptosporidium sp. chipmunk genotype I TaxID=1280935 RepID=UPI00351A6100|nr:putative coiled-coil [Cryptosporidium sp. chipmunk genotype I]
MPNVSIATKETAVYSIEYFEELLDNLKNENVDFVPVKDTKIFLSSKIDVDFDLFLSQSKVFLVNPNFISFIEFWRLYEELLKYSGKYNYLENYDGILNGMVYLRDRIIDESVCHERVNDLTDKSIINHIDEPIKGIGITVYQIHTIILEIISNNICNDSSSAYWKDVLNQIPQDGNSNMFLEFIEISNSILQWLKEYLNNFSQTSIYSTNTIVTRILSIKEETNYNSENDEIDHNSEKAILNYKSKKMEEKTEFDIHCNLLDENYDISELCLDSFESLPWKGQTMFSNFRELQISLQSILERVILHSGKGRNNFFLKRDEIIIRKISHMITELEDYLYNQFDILNKERDKSEQIEIENKNLKKRLKAAIEESEEYKFEIQNSINEKNIFEKELENFLSQKSRLSSDLISIKEEKKSLERKYEGLLYNYNELKERHDILCEENQQLINEINKYRGNKNESIERKKQNTYLDKKKDENIFYLELDQNIIRSQGHEANGSIYRSTTNKKSICEDNIKEGSNNKEEGKLYKYPAIIETIPDFLESSIQTPISCRSYRQKVGYFPEKTVDKELRIVNVVTPLTENKFENFPIQKRKKDTLTQKKKNLSKITDDVGCMLQ